MKDDLIGKAELGDIVSVIGFVRPKNATRIKGQWSILYGIDFEVKTISMICI